MKNRFYRFLEYINDFDYPEEGYKIVKIKSFNCYLCDRRIGDLTLSTSRWTISPVWDKKRIVELIKKTGKFFYKSGNKIQIEIINFEGLKYDINEERN